MDIKITKLKDYHSDYEDDFLNARYEKVLHINKLDKDKDKAAVQIINAFNQIHDIVIKNPTDVNKSIFDTFIKPAYEQLIFNYVKPTTANNSNRDLSAAHKPIPSPIDEQLIPEEQEQLLAELGTAHTIPAYITAPPNLINFIIV